MNGIGLKNSGGVESAANNNAVLGSIFNFLLPVRWRDPWSMSGTTSSPTAPAHRAEGKGVSPHA
jgi:hypothetical protein